jgi:predicted TPR repeat methyltransferase
MSSTLHDAYASDYDQQVQDAGCFLAEVLFGLCFEYIQANQRLLDLGIGSGLSAIPFAKAGLQVHGMDFSPALLALCRAKSIAVELKQHDLQAVPWPYADGSFDHLVCCGVFHFLADLEPIFAEAQRLLRGGGIFAYTSKAPQASSSNPQKYDWQSIDGFDIFFHHPRYLEGLIEHFQFTQLKAQRCFVGEDIFYIWVVRNVVK